MNDLGVGGDQQREAGGTRISKDQSPNKSPAKEGSPARFRSSKAGVLGPAVATAAGADRQRHAGVDADAGSPASSQESYAGVRSVRPPAAAAAAQQQQQHQLEDADGGTNSRGSVAPLHRAAAASAAGSPLRKGVNAHPQQQQQQQQQQQRLAVVLPGSPQVAPRRSSAVNFSPLHAGRGQAQQQDAPAHQTGRSSSSWR
ncbi:hypothetical protein OEZ86_006169 [Tetradesmus obliquus]|nr:hypothetical protein OEZ86_006169 [Tetradesmus obliquus]